MGYAKQNDVLGTANRGNPAESGLCTLCRADCTGRCETFLSSLKGRKMLYPRDFGTVTAGSSNINHLGVCYNNLRIQGFNYGAQGMPNGLSNSADDCIFPNVNLETEFGNEVKTKVRIPQFQELQEPFLLSQRKWLKICMQQWNAGDLLVNTMYIMALDSILQTLYIL